MDAAAGGERQNEAIDGERAREHEKRTLSAHLECRDVCVHACSYSNPRMKQTSSHFVGPHFKKKKKGKKRGHFRLNGQGEDYSKAETFCNIDYRLWEMNVSMCHTGGCVCAANAKVCR